MLASSNKPPPKILALKEAMLGLLLLALSVVILITISTVNSPIGG